MKGSLLVKPLGARFIRDQTHEITSDTFVRFQVGSHIYQTVLSKGLGANPVWYDEFYFQHNPKETLRVLVVESDAHGDKVIGETAIDTSRFVSDQIVDKSYKLTQDTKEVGDIHLLLFYDDSRDVENHQHGQAETSPVEFSGKYSKEVLIIPEDDTEDNFLVHGNVHPPHFSD